MVLNVTQNVWIHSVVNLVQPTERLGMMVYHDGSSQNQEIWTTIIGSLTHVDPIKDFNISLGYLKVIDRVPVVEVDELYLFNQALTAEEIKILGNLEQYP